MGTPHAELRILSAFSSNWYLDDEICSGTPRTELSISLAFPPKSIWMMKFDWALEGVDFPFFWKIDMKGPYMANIGKKNHVLEKQKNKNYQIFCLI